MLATAPPCHPATQHQTPPKTVSLQSKLLHSTASRQKKTTKINKKERKTQSKNFFQTLGCWLVFYFFFFLVKDLPNSYAMPSNPAVPIPSAALSFCAPQLAVSLDQQCKIQFHFWHAKNFWLLALLAGAGGTSLIIFQLPAPKPSTPLYPSDPTKQVARKSFASNKL